MEPEGKEESLNSLQQRVEKLESLLYSEEPSNNTLTNVLPTITEYSTKVKEVEKSNGNLKKIYGQLEELEKYVRMCHARSLEKPVDAKVHFIEASEKQVRTQAKHLENVEKLKWVLDSEHLKSRITPDLNTKMLKIAQFQAAQREQVGDSLDKTKQLVDNYNRAISAISSQFEQWNAVITRLEDQQQVVKD